MADYIITRFDDRGGSLEHFGIKGQKWGERRYQYEDGTLTPEGRLRYQESEKAAAKYKSPGKRIRGTVGKGLLGAALGTAAMLGVGVAVLTSGGSIGLAAGMKLAGEAAVGDLLGLSGLAGAATGLATTAIAGIKTGVQAAKVRSGLNFMNKYERAYKESTAGQA